MQDGGSCYAVRGGNDKWAPSKRNVSVLLHQEHKAEVRDTYSGVRRVHDRANVLGRGPCGVH
jgi:hypothetical protein